MQKSKKSALKPVGRKAAGKVSSGTGKRIRGNVVQSQASPANSKPAIRSGSKLDAIIALLRRPKGANMEDLCKVTGWQIHSVRGAISGTLKKKLGLTVTSDKTDGVLMYRVVN